MNTRLKIILRAALIFIAALSCSSETDDPIPYVPFSDIVVNTSLPQYYNLQLTGGWVYVSGGVKGIVVYHPSGNTYLAFERNCSFRPNDACSTVDMEPTGLRMFDPCCQSVFNMDGNPSGGPARNPLRRYRVDVQGSVLTISDEIIN